MDIAPSPEIAWLKQIADFAAAAGPYGVIGALALVIKTLWGEIKARDAMIATLMERRATDASASAERMATVATNSSNAVAANTIAMAEGRTILHAIRDAVMLTGARRE